MKILPERRFPPATCLFYPKKQNVSPQTESNTPGLVAIVSTLSITGSPDDDRRNSRVTELEPCDFGFGFNLAEAGLLTTTDRDKP